ALQHETTTQRIGLSPASPGNHPSDGPKTGDALTFKMDHSSGADHRWVLYVLAHCVAVTSWVLAMERVKLVPRPMRTSWYAGLGFTLIVVNMLVVLAVYA